ncbi:MAG: MogA/MoaB family molybdenum cofactor biosynthesis protein [Candidatus Natronoplasma sp.]
MSHEKHKQNAPDHVKIGVITVSDTRALKSDESGKKIREMLMEEEHEIVGYEIVKDDPDEIKRVIESIDAEAYILNGGTGISNRDVTSDVLGEVIDKELPGFGEAFRRLSFEEIGSAAILSRALAGVTGKEIYFALPGSTSAVELAMKELILPELGHIVFEVNK